MAAPSVDDLARSFERYLRAGNKSPRTIETYLEAVRGFAAHLAATSGRSLEQARREDVEGWIAVLLERWKPATAHNRYRGLHAFYRWLEEEDDLPSPMAKMKPPAVPDQPVPVADRAPAAHVVRRLRRQGLRGSPRHRPAHGAARRGAASRRATRHAPRGPRLRVRRGPGDRQGWAGAGPALRPQDRPGPGSLPTRPVTTPARSP